MIFNNYFIALNLEYFKRMFHVSKHLQGDRFLWSAKLVQLSVQLMHGNPNFLHLNQSKTGSDWQLTYLRIVRVSTCKWAVKLGRLKVDQEIPINSSVLTHHLTANSPNLVPFNFVVIAMRILHYIKTTDFIAIHTDVCRSYTY